MGGYDIAKDARGQSGRSSTGKEDEGGRCNRNLGLMKMEETGSVDSAT